MADDTRLSQDEFEALVDEVRGECDKCPMDCRNQLRIQGYQTERLEKAIQMLEIMVEALVEIVVQNHPDSFQKQLNKLTARILADGVNELEGPKNEQKKDECQRLSAGFYREIS